MPDHIHMLVGLPPTIAISNFVHDLKIATNNFMRDHHDHFPMFEKWEQGYCALTCSESDKERVLQYIIHQKEHHRLSNTRDELIALLKQFGVEYNELYI